MEKFWENSYSEIGKGNCDVWLGEPSKKICNSSLNFWQVSSNWKILCSMKYKFDSDIYFALCVLQIIGFFSKLLGKSENFDKRFKRMLNQIS